MNPIRKQIVTDESMLPVAVLINYADWQQIEKILAIYQQQASASPLSDDAGAIELTVDPLEYQQHARAKWS